MAPKKRMISSDLWESVQFMQASHKLKILAVYMVSRCDCIGIYMESPALTKVLIGFEVSETDILSVPMAIVKIGSWRFWLSDFCASQYGPLGNSGMHHHIAKKLYEAGLWGKVPVKSGSDFGYLPTLPPTLPPTLRLPQGEGEGEGEGIDLKEHKSNTVPAREKLKVERERYPADFQAFWAAYPKKTGKDAALKAWLARDKARTLPDLDTIHNALRWQYDSDQWRKENGQYIPNPSTYINQARWEDERPETYEERLARETAELMGFNEVRT